MFNHHWGRSIKGIEHVEKENPEEPHRDQNVVDSESDVLMVLLDLRDDRHAVNDQDAHQRHPGQDGVVYAVIQEIDAQQG